MLWSVLIVFALAAGGCSRNESDEPTTLPAGKPTLSDEQRSLASVETGMMEFRLLSAGISCTGEIEVPPRGMASVTAPLGGYVADTDMVPGRYVKKGQLLARLTNPEYIELQQSYLETAGQLKFAEQDFQRQKLLEEQHATAGKRLQESESVYTVLKARLAGLKARLRMIGVDVSNLEKGTIQEEVFLRAPISGYVTAVNHHPGEFVGPQEVIFEIVNMNDLHLHLNVFEQDISQVNKGQRIRFRLTSGGDARYEGTVSLVSPKRNMEERSFDVHGHIVSGEDELKPGMYVEAEILVGSDSLPAVPESAVVFHENASFVITQESGQYTLEQVRTGVKMDGWVEIKDPVAIEGKQIVTQGASRLSVALRRE